VAGSRRGFPVTGSKNVPVLAPGDSFDEIPLKKTAMGVSMDKAVTGSWLDITRFIKFRIINIKKV